MALRWEVELSFMQSMTSTDVFRAVSTPMESSVPGMSLPMVAGIPTVGRPSPSSASAPERLPPPPSSMDSPPVRTPQTDNVPRTVSFLPAGWGVSRGGRLR